MVLIFYYSNEVSFFELFELELGIYVGNVVMMELMMLKVFCDVFLLVKRCWKMRSMVFSLFFSIMVWVVLGMMVVRNWERGGVLFLVFYRVGVSISFKRVLKLFGICVVGLSFKRSEKIWKMKGMNLDIFLVRINVNGFYRWLIRLI